MPVHLRPVPNVELAPTTKVNEVFMVIQRSNGDWSPGAKIMSLHQDEREARDEARRLKEQRPHQTFGVFVLIGEAQTVPEPIQFVRAVHPVEVSK